MKWGEVASHVMSFVTVASSPVNIVKVYATYLFCEKGIVRCSSVFVSLKGLSLWSNSWIKCIYLRILWMEWCHACAGAAGIDWGIKVTTKMEGLPQQTQNICITIVQCWTNVGDAGPTLYKCYTNVLCLLGNPYFHLLCKSHLYLYIDTYPLNNNIHS